VSDRIDYETFPDPKQIPSLLTVYQPGVANKTVVVTLLVIIRDINDHKPIFSQSVRWNYAYTVLLYVVKRQKFSLPVLCFTRFKIILLGRTFDNENCPNKFSQRFSCYNIEQMFDFANFNVY